MQPAEDKEVTKAHASQWMLCAAGTRVGAEKAVFGEIGASLEGIGIKADWPDRSISNDRLARRAFPFMVAGFPPETQESA